MVFENSVACLRHLDLKSSHQRQEQQCVRYKKKLQYFKCQCANVCKWFGGDMFNI